MNPTTQGGDWLLALRTSGTSSDNDIFHYESTLWTDDAYGTVGDGSEGTAAVTEHVTTVLARRARIVPLLVACALE